MLIPIRSHDDKVEETQTAKLKEVKGVAPYQRRIIWARNRCSSAYAGQSNFCWRGKTMDVQSYFQSLGQEVNSLKQRVRYLLEDPHWQTDGEWKESVVRQVLRRHLPMTAVVSRGFVVTAEKATTQIDILVHDASKPVVFRDGDLVFVTPDAVLGLIEVKSRVGSSQFAEAIAKLSQNIEMVRLYPNSRAFAAFFAFETKGQLLENCLSHIAGAAPTWNHRLDFGALGESGFIRYWNEDPANPQRSYESWHSYELIGLAAGYFVHNVVDAVSPQSVLRNNEVWFPAAGKEPRRKGVQPGQWTQERANTAMEPLAPSDSKRRGLSRVVRRKKVRERT